MIKKYILGLMPIFSQAVSWVSYSNVSVIELHINTVEVGGCCVLGGGWQDIPWLPKERSGYTIGFGVGGIYALKGFEMPISIEDPVYPGLRKPGVKILSSDVYYSISFGVRQELYPKYPDIAWTMGIKSTFFKYSEYRESFLYSSLGIQKRLSPDSPYWLEIVWSGKDKGPNSNPGYGYSVGIVRIKA